MSAGWAASGGHLTRWLDESASAKRAEDAAFTERTAVGCCLILAVTLGALLHSWVFLCPAEELGWRGEDDACYYYGIARNIASGSDITFDGIHPTNGFHPLWLGILTGIFSVAPDDGSALRLVHVFQWLCFIFSGAAVGVLAWRSVGTIWAPAATGIFMVIPPTTRLMLSGMETSLAAACVLSCVLRFERLWTLGRSPKVSEIALLGIMFAAAGLARFECAIFGMAASCAVFLRGSWPDRRTRGVLLGAIFAGPILLYLVFSAAYFGQMLPVSGAIKRAGALSTFQALRSEGAYGQIISDAIRMTMPSDGIATVLQTQAGISIGAPWVLAAGYILMAGPFLLPSIRQRLTAGSVLLLACSVAQILIDKAFYYGRSVPLYYWVPALAAFPISLVILTQASWRIPNRRLACASIRAVMVLACGFILLAGSRYQWLLRDAHLTRKDGYYHSTYAASQWLNAHTPDHAVAGAWNAGVIGFYSDRTVINLDGYVNSVDFARSLVARDSDLRIILDGLPITHLVDRVSNAKSPLELYPELARDWRQIARIAGPQPHGLNGGFCVYERIKKPQEAPTPLASGIDVNTGGEAKSDAPPFLRPH